MFLTSFPFPLKSTFTGSYLDPDSNIKRKVIREMNTDSILDDKDIIVNFFSGAITVL